MHPLNFCDTRYNFHMTKQLDFLSVGDITTDAFIRLQEASVHCNINHENCELCVKFADKIPYEFVEVIRAVGNAPNAAVSAARLGLHTGLVTNMGDDQNGKECLAVLKDEHIDIDYAKIHNGAKTNYHYVLWYESERTILIKHEPYEYRLPEISPTPRWLYLSSFRGTPEYHVEIGSYLEKHSEVKLAFQPGKFEINLGAAKLANFYRRAEVFVCNKEEAEKLGKKIMIPDNFYGRVSALHEKKEQIHEEKKEFPLQDIAETDSLYFSNYLLDTCKAKVLKVLEGKYVVLDKTVFYPTGGGQLHDIGTMNRHRFVDNAACLILLRIGTNRFFRDVNIF